MEKGKLRVSKNLGGKIDKKYTVPNIYNLAPREKYHLKEVEFELDDDKNVLKVIFEGVELPKNKDEILRRERVIERRKEEQEFAEKEKKEKKANEDLINFYKSDFAKAKLSRLPIDSSDILDGKEWKVDNFSLRLNKLARFEEDERNYSKSKFSFFKTDRGKVIYKPKYEFSQAFISEICNKNLEAAKNLIRTENLKNENLEINWRMAVGLGHESVYETSITLHHIYGVPYIPASSIKGVVRSYIIQEVFGETVPDDEKDFPLVNAEYRALKNEDFCKIFGCPKDIKKVRFGDNKPVYKDEKKKKYDYNAKEKTGLGEENMGKIIFFDAFPTEKPNIEPDIMNVHYPDYYGKENVPPTDYQNPNPIPFLTVKDTKFQFVIGAKREKLDNFKIGNKTIDIWLKEALENHGIGAKTAVGYGRLS